MVDVNETEVSEYFIGLQDQLRTQLEADGGNETILKFFDEYPQFLETYARTFLGITQFAGAEDVDTAVSNTLSDTVTKLKTYPQPQQIDRAIIKKLNISAEIQNPLWINLLDSSVRLAPFLNECVDDLSIEVLVSMVILDRMQNEATAVGSDRGTVRGAIDFLERFPQSLEMMNETYGGTLTRAEFLERVLNPKRTAIMKALTLSPESDETITDKQLDSVVTSLMDPNVVIENLDTAAIFDALTIDETTSSQALTNLKYHTVNNLISITNEAVRNPGRMFEFDSNRLSRVMNILTEYPNLLDALSTSTDAARHGVNVDSLISALHNEKLLLLIESYDGQSLNVNHPEIRGTLIQLLGLDETMEARPISQTDKLFEALEDDELDPLTNPTANVLHAIRREFNTKQSSPITILNAVLRQTLGQEPTVEQLKAAITNPNSIVLLKHLMFLDDKFKFDQGLHVQIAQLIQSGVGPIPDALQDVLFVEDGNTSKTDLNRFQRAIAKKHAFKTIGDIVQGVAAGKTAEVLQALENTSLTINARAKFFGVYPKFVSYLIERSGKTLTEETAFAAITIPEWNTLLRIALFQCREAKGFKSAITTEAELFDLMGYFILERGSMHKTSEHLNKVPFSLNQSILINPTNLTNDDEEMHLIFMTDSKVKKLRQIKNEEQAQKKT